MTRQRFALYLLLAVVAAAAAVLSFSALRDLALLCGFGPELAWLLPVVLDAGAAAGSIVWLASWTPDGATRYGRLLAMVLLGSSVGGNALGHGLEAYGTRPHWLVVVGVSAIAPTVLGALVHLVVLVGRPAPARQAASPPVMRMQDETASLLQARDELLAEEETEPGGPWPPVGGIPDRRAAVAVERDGAVIDDLRAMSRRHRGRQFARDEVKAMYGMGSPRASRLLTLLGWMPRDTEQADEGTS